ncbi:DUF3226 domain-containing protein [Mesorhizobium sp. M0491]|uniref:DUF3226 domain-containing protein n=1 Tax=Mesorhizobium sp. M0491 TaxID=2956950 RepID=UPI003338FA21
MTYLVEKPDASTRPGATRLLMAEGYAEVGFIETYLATLQTPINQVILTCFKGVANLAQSVRVMRKVLDPGEGAGRFGRVGVFADAEQNPAGRLDAVVDSADQFGFGAVSQNLRQTNFCDAGQRRFAFHLAPNNVGAGMIEDLVAAEIAGSSIAQCLTDYRACVLAADAMNLSSKAQAQIFILTKRNSDAAGLGRAFQDGILDVMHPAYANFRDAINRLVQ